MEVSVVRRREGRSIESWSSRPVARSHVRTTRRERNLIRYLDSAMIKLRGAEAKYIRVPRPRIIMGSRKGSIIQHYV